MSRLPVRLVSRLLAPALVVLAACASDDAPAARARPRPTPATNAARCSPSACRSYTASEAQRCRRNCEGTTVPVGCEADDARGGARRVHRRGLPGERHAGACGDEAPANAARARCAQTTDGGTEGGGDGG